MSNSDSTWNPEAIRRARSYAGISQAQLAEAIGSDQSNVSGWESGRRCPGVETIRKIASAVGVPFSGLLCEVYDVRYDSSEQSWRIEEDRVGLLPGDELGHIAGVDRNYR